MASVVDTGVKHFTSDMPNGPVVNGLAGSMIAFLDACLVTGWDLKTVTIVVASGVATVSWSGTHGAMPDVVVLISGVTGGLTGLNGEQRVVTKPSGSTLTFATSVPDGAASGTISMKVAPLGWTKEFTGTNKAVYRSSDLTGSRHYLRVDDSAANVTRVVGYETMSDVDTGAGPFPTVAQMSGGGYWHKCWTAGNTGANQWLLFGDSKIFYHNIAVRTGQPLPAAQYGATRCFGEPVAAKPGGDPFFTILNYGTNNVGNTQNIGQLGGSSSSLTVSPRNYLGTTTATQHWVWPSTKADSANVLSGLDATMGSMPSQVDGSIRTAKKYLSQVGGGNAVRGELPGMYHIPMSGALGVIGWNNKLPGSGPLSGRKLVSTVITPESGWNDVPIAGSWGAELFDVTGPWR